MPDELKNGKKVVGTKQLTKALRRGDVSEVYLAEDADPLLTSPVNFLAGELDIPVHWVPRMAELGKACGISVGTAAAGILR